MPIAEYPKSNSSSSSGGGTVQDPTTKAIIPTDEGIPIGNARGNNATDLQTVRTSASQVASGDYSTVFGKQNTASGLASVSLGYGNTASSTIAVALGYNNTSSSPYAVAIGLGNTTSKDYSTSIGKENTSSQFYTVSLGQKSVSYIQGQFSFSNERITSAGDSQYSVLVLRERTVNATPKIMTLNFAGNLVRTVLPSGKTWRFVIELVAKNTSNGDTFAATYVGAIKRVGSTTSLIGTVTERDKVNDAGASTWSVAVTANDTNESLDITVTGEASTTINWCAVVHLTEVA